MSNLFDLSPDQVGAREEVHAALEDDEADVALLCGPAGSGKTTLMRDIAADLEAQGRDVVQGAPTGCAARNLRNKTGKAASTIHHLLFGKVDEEELTPEEMEKDPRKLKLRFGEPHAPCEPDGRVLIDEASMVGTKLHDILVQYLPEGAKILYVGDREQLPPVNDDWGPDFSRPDALLVEVHRQALESPIIRYATNIRLNKERDFTDWADGSGVSRYRRSDLDYAAEWLVERIAGDADDATLLTFTNAVRQGLNKRVRAKLGLDEKGVLAVGDQVMVLKNNRMVDLYNGDARRVLSVVPVPEFKQDFGWEVAEIRLVGAPRVRVRLDLLGADGRAWSDFEKELEREFGKRASCDWINIDYGWARTVHKAQGNEWKDVAFVACQAFDKLRYREPSTHRRMLYTAVTRARENFHRIG